MGLFQISFLTWCQTACQESMQDECCPLDAHGLYLYEHTPAVRHCRLYTCCMLYTGLGSSHNYLHLTVVTDIPPDTHALSCSAAAPASKTTSGGMSSVVRQIGVGGLFASRSILSTRKPAAVSGQFFFIHCSVSS